MAQLFKAAPGTVFDLESPRLEEASDSAEQLMGRDSFRSISLHEGKMLDLRTSQLLGAMGGLTLPVRRPLTVNSGEAAQTVIGFDIIRGKSAPAEGTVYHRPVAADARRPEDPDLLDKSFVHVPLDGPLSIGVTPQRRWAVNPGQAFLSREGESYEVHVAPDKVALEFVLVAGEVSADGAWNRYVRQQPNPNF